jgi:drug/metabolite transporter (DMT)-like permease
VSGALLAAASGVGFGVFQSINVRALRGTDDSYASTFVQVGTAAVALAAASLASGRLEGVLEAPLWALGDFALAGLLHFLGGWSLLNLSQQRIGAARTGPLLTTVPVFGVVIAAVTIGQIPGPVTLLAIAIMCAGAYLVATGGGTGAGRPADALPALGCAFMWALSPIFILRGLEGFDSPVAGLTVGLVISVLAFAPLLVLWRGAGQAWTAVKGSVGTLKLIAGVLVAVATWWRWAALEDTAVGAVLALNLLSVPTVLLLAPVIAGRHVERVTLGLWAGAGLVVSGALVLVAA